MASTTADRPAFHFRQPSVVPGFGLSLGVTLAYLSLIVLL
ncbi:sulfate transport system permease protein, partial [Aureimonas phyllosphaerae]|nr:sulfate transport system permease protein [Aureimonas phyllosphaerae]MBB3960365.1 sulfate transport system permease protein [Aureimonas phyllosphaerae]